MPATSDDILPGELFKALFEKSPGSLLVKADVPHFTIAAVSDAYLQITSARREDLVGKSFFEVFPDVNDDPDDPYTARKVFGQVQRTGEKLDVPVYRYDMLDPASGRREERYWSCSNIPITGKTGGVEYILNTVVDISGEVKAKQAAIESENRLLMAAEATGLAVWELNIPEVRFSSSPQMAAIFGHPADTEMSIELIRNQVNPDDMENVVIRSYYEALTAGNYAYEARITWPDDSQHWIRVKGVVLSDEKKKPYRMLGTVVDITESKRDEIRKNDFIAMASHELKTPLTSLKAYIQLLESKLPASSDPFIATALSKASNQVSKMTALVHSFLDLSKLEPGKLQLKKQGFDINKLVEEMIAESRAISNTHVLQFKPTAPIMVSADKEKIGQVISNFISNAIKYSPKGSSIEITASVADSEAEVSVSDCGVGIRAKDREKIFQRFYRANEAAVKHVAGFGIGLYLSSEIIQRHKGRIGVESSEGKGSRFYFRLPLA